VDRILEISTDQVEALPGDENEASGALLSGVVKQDGQAFLLIAPAELLEGETKTAAAGSVSTSNRLEQATKAADDVRRTVVLEIGRESLVSTLGLFPKRSGLCNQRRFRTLRPSSLA
jgi:hypothetical protein